MRRPAWLVPVATVAAVALTARLGWWQLDRAAQQIALQERRSDQLALPPLRAAELPGPGEEVPLDRQVELEGNWLESSTVLLENRSMDGRQGFVVVTALVLPDGRALAVQRGWLPRDPNDRTRIVPFATRSGTIALSGRLALSATRIWQLGDTGTGPIRQNLDLAAYAIEVRRPLLPYVVVQGGSPTPEDGLLRNWPRPASEVHKHYGYAFQWFALSALLVALYVWFRILRPRLRTAG